MICLTWRNLASEYWSSSEPVSAPSVQARSSVWKSRMSASGVRLRFQDDVAAGVVVDLGERLVDAGDAFLDGFPLARQLRLEVGDFADGVLVQQLLEARLETRQVVGLKRVEHRSEFAAGLDADIHLPGFQPQLLPVVASSP